MILRYAGSTCQALYSPSSHCRTISAATNLFEEGIKLDIQNSDFLDYIPLRMKLRGTGPLVAYSGDGQLSVHRLPFTVGQRCFPPSPKASEGQVGKNTATSDIE